MPHHRTTKESPQTCGHSPVTSQHSLRTVVVKVGGSLLGLLDLSEQLQRFLHTLQTPRLILVVGGGAAADLVRQRDRLDGLGDDKSHWLAVRAMSFNSFLIEGILPHSVVVYSIAECRAQWEAGSVPILDPHSFLVCDDACSLSPLPHTWAVTSDTIAARVARATEADELVLLKSVPWPMESPMADAARQGIVDEYFAHELQRGCSLRVRIENLSAED